MQKTNKTYDINLTINTENILEKNCMVRTLNYFIDNLKIRKDLSNLYKKGRNPAVEPITMLKLIVYAYIKGIYSSRKIEDACKRNLDFIWLLKNLKPPTRNTICRFIKKVSPLMKKILSKFVDYLSSIGEINFENIFIDGTKIEAYANKYSFVWRKSIEKSKEKLQEKIKNHFLLYGVSVNDDYLYCLLILQKYLKEMISNEAIKFVYGKGKRKSPVQREYEIITEYIEKLERYCTYEKILGKRNSFSKTDTEATFMRMKEDHMLNGQLKPAYNIQIGVASGYIVNFMASQERTDVNTLIPFLEDTSKYHKYKNIIADAGYESLENYRYLKENDYKSYIKPNNYEIRKKRNYKTKVSNIDNMTYSPKDNKYICANNVTLSYKYTGKRKNKSSFEYIVDIYEAEDCSNCEFKSLCKKTNRNKTIQVNKEFQLMRKISNENIKSEYGIKLRTNRSIQVEGVFALIKESRKFRRFSYRGLKNVETQFLLISLAHNMINYISKRDTGRLKKHLF